MGTSDWRTRGAAFHAVRSLPAIILGALCGIPTEVFPEEGRSPGNSALSKEAPGLKPSGKPAGKKLTGDLAGALEAPRGGGKSLALRGGDGHGAGLTLCEACSQPPIVCGDTITGSLSPGDCALSDQSFIDVYELVVPPGSMISVRLTSTAFDTYLFLIDSSCALVAQNDDCIGSGTNSCLVFFPEPGTYFIGANSYDPQETGSYTLETRCFENTLCRDCPGEPLACGDLKAGRLTAQDCTLGDGRFQDLYRVEIAEKSLLRLRVIASAFDATLTVLDTSCSPVAVNDDCNPGDPSPCLDVLLDAGVHHLSVSSYDPGGVGDYTVQLTCPDIGICLDCEAGAISCGEGATTGTLSAAPGCARSNGAPIQLYRLEVRDPVEISLALASTAFEPHLVLLDQACQTVSESESCLGGSQGACLEFRPLLPGTYYVGVSSSEPESAGDFQLETVCKPFVPCECAAGTIACGAPSSGALESGDCLLPPDGVFIDAWTFELPEAQRVNIEMTSSAFDAVLVLLDDVCQPIGQANDCPDPQSTNPCALIDLPAGRYFLIATSASPATGAYDIRISCAEIPFCRDCSVGSISCGRSVEGALESGPCRLGDGSFIEFYEFSVPAPMMLDFNLSAAFDTYLFIYDASCIVLATNDDCSEDDRNSCLSIGLPEGTFYVGVNSYEGGVTGPYTLQVSGAECDLCASCKAGDIECDTTLSGSLGSEDCNGEGGTPVDMWALEVAEQSDFVIRLESEDFDPVVRVLDGACMPVAENDDCEDTLDACLRLTLEPGTYTVAATTFFPDAAGSYELEVSCGAADRLPGDCNEDGKLDIADPVCLLGHLFLGSPEFLPCGDGTLNDSANQILTDFNGQGGVNLADAVAALLFLFGNSPPHPLGQTCAPIPGCTPKCGS